MSDCISLACCVEGCQATIHLHHDLEARLRKTHEWFYCPSGHAQHFTGKSEETQLREKVRRLERQVEMWRDNWEDAVEQRDDWKIAAKSCPFDCGYRVLRKSKPENIAYTLAMHLVEAHGAVFPTEDDLAAVSPADTTPEGGETE